MLLRYFRKIDAYSGIRVIAAGIITFCIVWSTDYSNWQELLLSFALGSLMLWLCWTILRDRWVLKTSALRFITYFLLSIHWSAEFDIMDLIFFSSVIGPAISEPGQISRISSAARLIASSARCGSRDFSNL